jgi:hypothetical protein
MGGTGRHYVKWNKLDTERQVSCILSHIWNFLKSVNLNVEYYY